MTIDRIENLGRYASVFPGGEALARFLQDGWQTLPVGSHPVPGADLTVNVSQYQPRDPAGVRWEAHHTHMDVHLTLSGDEGFSWMPVDALTALSGYDPNADVAFYDDPALGSVMTVPEGYFVIVWPHDAHRPTMAAGQDRATRRKGVVKVVVADGGEG